MILDIDRISIIGPFIPFYIAMTAVIAMLKIFFDIPTLKRYNSAEDK